MTRHVALLGLLFTACGGGSSASDGGTIDGARADARGPDAPRADASPADASLPDAFRPDAVPGCALPPSYVAPTPASVGIPAAGLALWVRADLGVSLDDASGVCEIDDLSGLGHDLTQLEPTLRPGVATLGGHPALALTGTRVLGRAGVLGIAPTSARTIVTVAQLDAPAARTILFEQGATGTPGTYLGSEANTFNSVGSRWGAYFTNNAYDTAVATSTDPVVHVLRTDSLTAGEPVLAHLSVRINGTGPALTRTAGGLGNTNIESFAAADVTWVGAGSAGADFQLAEVLVWSTALTPTELTQVETYLLTRYGIPIPE